MRVPDRPHTMKNFMPKSEDSGSNSDSSETSNGKTAFFTKRSDRPPPRPRNTPKSDDHATSQIQSGGNLFNRGRERTRMSAVQRLVERKMAQKEKDRERERDELIQNIRNRSRRSSSVGAPVASEMTASLRSASATRFPNLEAGNNSEYMASMVRSLSRERLNYNTTGNGEAAKTVITISSGKPVKIRETSPSKRASPEAEVPEVPEVKDVLNKDFSPLKSTELFKEFKKSDEENVNKNERKRKTSYTTEKTIEINSNDNNKTKASIRKMSIDIQYVYEHHPMPSNPNIFANDNDKKEDVDEKAKRNSTGSTDSNESTIDVNAKRRISLEQRFHMRMSTSSDESSSSGSTPEPLPRQRHRKASVFDNINIIHEDQEISNESINRTKGFMSNSNMTSKLNMDLPKAKTSFVRRFSQGQMTPNSNMTSARKRSSSPVRKISLQNTTTINTDR